MATIYLIRHGQKQPHAGNPGLTEVGVNQAKQTGEYLSRFPISKIISSPFKRTVETAQNIADVLQLEHSLHNNLTERMNWNDKNLTRNEFLSERVKTTNDRDYIPKYGNSSRSTGRKISQLVGKITTNNDEHIVLVTHGGAIVDYLRNLFGDEELVSLVKEYDEGEDYEMLNCAINMVKISDKSTLELLNFVDHLTESSE